MTLAVIDGGASTSTAARLTAGARAEVLSIVEQACGASSCDLVRVVIHGEEIARMEARDPQRTGERLIALIQEDAGAREHGRHSYTVSAIRGDAVIYSSQVRVTGGGQPGAALSVEPSAAGALKVALRHQEAIAGLLVRSHASVLDAQSREIERLRERCEKLEGTNDALRAELRRAIEGGRADEMLAEAERRKSELMIEAGRKLLRYMPAVLAHLFGSPDEIRAAREAEEAGKGKAEGKPAKLAPASFVRALASVTDQQLAEARAVLTPAQAEIVERARSGSAVTLSEAVLLGAELGDEASEALMTILRPDQVAALVDAMADLRPGEE